MTQTVHGNGLVERMDGWMDIPTLLSHEEGLVVNVRLRNGYQIEKFMTIPGVL